VVRVVGAQPSLFDPSRTVERRLASGATVRVKLEPLGDQHVRILEYRRRWHDAGRWERRSAEEGRVVPFAALGLGLPFDAIFA
jgi:hypothetical protein